MTVTRAGQWLVGFASVVVAAALTGCGPGLYRMTPEQTRLAQRAYLAPFLSETMVVCDRLEVEISRDFYLNVSNPGLDKRRQRLDIEKQDGVVEKTWRNLTGDQNAYFTVKIAEATDPVKIGVSESAGTTYTVMNEFTLRVRGRADMTLSARAFGGLVIVEERGSQPPREARECPEYTIVNGVVKR
jgi:hypothetical protein